ncbi:sensor histidine kinase [Alkalicoccus chagannorensis]|uniref:sensor histidine kinase n=1 Tax=Alkalicoccus chagannorensis TaxID=427072 RepID=UPI000417AF4C|nr:ATP-binding protein [Alkalicoccus chagannorensis]
MKNTFKHWSLRAKILTVLLLFTAVMSSLSFFFILSLDDMSDVSESLTTEEVPELLWLSHWESQIAMKEQFTEFGVESSFCCDFVANYEDFRDEGESSMLSLHDAPPESLEPVQRDLERLDFMILNHVHGLVEIGNEAGAAEYIESTYFDELESLRTDIEASRQEVQGSLEDQQSYLNVIISDALDLLVLVTGIVILLAMFFAYRISAGFTRPVRTMESQLQQIADGRYGAEVEETTQVELAPLARSINQMSTQLEQSFDMVLSDKMYREQILDSLPIGIVTSDERSGEVQLNRTARDWLGDHFHVRQLPELKREAAGVHRFWDVLTSKHIFSNEKVLYKEHGEERMFLASQSRLAGEEDETIGKVFYFIDITETEELERQVRQTEKLAVIGELSAGAAHEIRNPLAVIDGFLGLMRHSMDPEEQEKFRLDLLLKEIERINAIIEDMLMLSKPAAPALIRTGLQNTLNDILPLIQEQEANHHVQICVDLEPVELDLDAAQMKQVFHNLVRNSIEAMPDGGRIDITGKVRTRTYTVEIADNGPGIPQEKAERMFDPFATTKEKGTGLGLTIAERIMNHHNGSLDLKGTSSEGTSFCLTFPMPSSQEETL